MQHILWEEYRIVANSPREVFRKSEENLIVAPDVVQELLEFIEIRNLATHVYNAKMAQGIVSDIVKHVHVFEKVLEACDKYSAV